MEREDGLALMQHLARAHERQRERDPAGGAREGGGWIRFGIPEGNPWSWNTLASLIARELVERIDTYNDALVRLSDLGWSALSHGSRESR